MYVDLPLHRGGGGIAAVPGAMVVESMLDHGQEAAPTGAAPMQGMVKKTHSLIE